MNASSVNWRIKIHDNITLKNILQFFFSKFWIGEFFRQLWENLEEILIGTGAKFWSQMVSKKILYRMHLLLFVCYICRCICPREYTGRRCEELYVPCQPSPCRNGGTCSQSGSLSYQCICQLGRSPDLVPFTLKKDSESALRVGQKPLGNKLYIGIVKKLTLKSCPQSSKIKIGIFHLCRGLFMLI